MLTPHEIFLKMPSSMAQGIFAFLHEHQKPLYRATLDTLAKSRKLRPVFLEKKPRAEQHAWLVDQLRKRINDDTAAHVLQLWLVGAHKTLLCEFLDGFGIAHDDNGTVEILPAAPSLPELVRVIDSLRPRYDSLLLAVYLNTFQSLDFEGWPTLDALIQQDPSLQLTGA
ncbi:MAG: hypothetical protein DVB28_000410 [Verrucomicrobia bacterium]|nr:MAG: hypothetical protein DVB28_000410 [Verrucomicrobiota bacterium]